MVWYAWAVIAYLALNAVYQFYLVDRTRPPKTFWEAAEAAAEMGLVIWAVASLAS